MQAAFDVLARVPVPMLIIGGNSLAAHGIQRMTVDVDCLVAATDFDAVAQLLIRGGFDNVVHAQNFSAFNHRTPGIPKIDVMRVDAPTFAKLHEGSRRWDFGGELFDVPALDHLIALKLHTMKNNPERRGKDGWDIAALLDANRGAISRDHLRGLCERFGPPGAWDTFAVSHTDEPST